MPRDVVFGHAQARFGILTTDTAEQELRFV